MSVVRPLMLHALRLLMLTCLYLKDNRQFTGIVHHLGQPKAATVSPPPAIAERKCVRCDPPR